MVRQGHEGTHRTGIDQEIHPADERMAVFERPADAPQVNPAVATSAAAFVNIALSKMAPPHVHTTGFKIASRGRRSTSAREGASAAILLRFH